MNHPEPNGISRRRFAMAGLTAGAALLTPGALFSEGTQPFSNKSFMADLATIKPGANTSFGPLKQIDAGLLNVGYAEDGPADGPAVILLHGWPYDIYSFVDVAPLLAAKGYHVIVPICAAMAPPAFSPAQPYATPSSRPSASTSSLSWMHSKFRKPPSPALTGAHAQRTSWQYYGRNAARQSSPSAAI